MGRAVQLDGISTIVVGVMPPRLGLTFQDELWRPLPFHIPETMDRRFHSVRAIGRLRSGVTMARAQGQLSTIAKQLEQAHREDDAWGVHLVPYRDEVVGTVEPALVLVFVAVGLVLLIACGNVANLDVGARDGAKVGDCRTYRTRCVAP